MRNFNYLLNFSKFLHTFLPFYFFTFLPFYFFTFLLFYLFYHFTFKNYGWHSNAHTLS